MTVLVLSALGVACGGSNKPPMQPDSDNAALDPAGGDAPAGSAAPAGSSAAPAHS